MSYCRFTNTLQDLIDCRDNWQLSEEASDEEIEAQKRLITLCKEIAHDYGDD